MKLTFLEEVRALMSVRCTALLSLAIGCSIFSMASGSYAGQPLALTPQEVTLRQHLEQHISELTKNIGGRHICQPKALEDAAKYIERVLEKNGGKPVPQKYKIETPVVKKICKGSPGQKIETLNVRNISTELRSDPPSNEIIIVGAHYDSDYYESGGTPGANDNATGTAAVLEIARLLGKRTFPRTVRFVLFVNEEEPFFSEDKEVKELMGSYYYASRSRGNGEKIVGMLSLETMGYYSDAEDSQPYPSSLFKLFYPSSGNFIAFVGDWSSRDLLRRSIGSFRNKPNFPSEKLVLPRWFIKLLASLGVKGMDWSDHRSFWENGYPAIMITDTAALRYEKYYHTKEDTIDKIDFDRLARVAAKLASVVEDLAGK
jgi:hypothetical protein